MGGGGNVDVNDADENDIFYIFDHVLIKHLSILPFDMSIPKFEIKSLFMLVKHTHAEMASKFN